MLVTHDPVLASLADRAAKAAAEADRAATALRNYLLGTPVESEGDLVLLKDAEAEFGKSNLTLRRWASDEGLGQLIEGKWSLSRQMVRKYKGHLIK